MQEDRLKSVSNILISIIVPVYNGERYLRECLDSILEQTYKNIELVLVNDGSTDASESIFEKYAAKDKRIIIVNKENGGLVTARKAGIGISHGKYIMMVDADDWIERTAVSSLITYLQAMSPELVISGEIKEYNLYSQYGCSELKEGFYSKKEIRDVICKSVITDEFVWNVMPTSHVILYESKLLKKCIKSVDDRIRMGEDAALFFSCILVANSLCITKCWYYHYRQSENSMIHNLELNHKKSIQYYFEYRYLVSLLKKIEDGELVNSLMHQFDVLLFYYLLLSHYISFNTVNIRTGKLFPFQIVQGSRVILYGAGAVGNQLIDYIEKTKLCEVIAVADKRFSYSNNIRNDKIEEISPKEISKKNFDFIVIAAVNFQTVNSIKQYLKGIVEETKVVTIDYSLFNHELISEIMDEIFDQSDLNKKNR